MANKKASPALAMNDPTKKSALLRKIAAILRTDVADVQCLDQLSNGWLEHLAVVFQRAMDEASED